MGIFRKEWKVMLINFLSSRTNLTIFQCLLYFIIGHIMGEYLSWQKMGIMFVVMFIIQFITRTKAVADGMMFNEWMIQRNIHYNKHNRIGHDFDDILNKIEQDTKDLDDKDLN